MTRRGLEVVRSLDAHYRSGLDSLASSFFAPCLELCESYDRAAGFFSSSALLAWSRALPAIVGGERPSTKVRLLISPHLSSADAATLRSVATAEQRDAVRQSLADKVVIDAIGLASGTGGEAQGRLLAYLIAAGFLEIRFAFASSAGGDEALYHEKMGVFTFPWGDRVAFTGSANESLSGHSRNFESVDVFRSWVPDDIARVQVKQEQFEEAWRGNAAGLSVIPLSPKALERVRERLAPTGAGGELAAGSAPEARKWRHQEEALAAFLREERGVLEMATGTGKTRVALNGIEQLRRLDGIDTAIVAADGTDLLDQWNRELVKLAPDLRMSVLRQYAEHRDGDRFIVESRNRLLLSSRMFLPRLLRSVRDPSRTLLVHDEVHRLGSPANRLALEGLSDRVRFRLGLSATPEREYDEDGTAFVFQHVGRVIFRFELADAIRRGVLAPFDYQPIRWQADAVDRERLQQVYRRAAARKASGDPMTREELWIELARVYKTSRVKLPLLTSALSAAPELLERSIIFVADKEYGAEVLDVVHRFRADFHSYFDDDQREVFKRFARGELECLVTCHRLSEGIDVRSLRGVILLSSDRAQLETIQRVGRCLRSDPADPMKRAVVLDFVREDEGKDEPTADEARANWLEELSRIEPAEV